MTHPLASPGSSRYVTCWKKWGWTERAPGRRVAPWGARWELGAGVALDIRRAGGAGRRGQGVGSHFRSPLVWGLYDPPSLSLKKPRVVVRTSSEEVSWSPWALVPQGVFPARSLPRHRGEPPVPRPQTPAAPRFQGAGSTERWAFLSWCPRGLGRNVLGVSGWGRAVGP